MKKLDLKYTIWDKANGYYLYQRAVPEGAIWLIQKRKITASLGRTPHEARTRYLPIHTKWQQTIDRAIAEIKGEPDDEAFMDRVTEFLNAEAAMAGGTLPEIDWTLNGAKRSDLFDKWKHFNLIKDATNLGQLFDGNNDADLDRIIDAWRFFRSAMRGRIALSAQLPVALPNATAPTEDGQVVMSLSDLEVKWRAEKKRSVAAENDMRRMVKLFVGVNGNVPIHQIQAKHRIAFRDAVQQINIKAQSRNKLLRTLAGLGSYAEKLGVVTSNPLRAAAFRVTEEVIREPFTDADIRKVFGSEAWANRSPKYRDFIRWYFVIAAYTGARIGEVAQLRAEDVYRHEGVWVIEFTDDEVTGQSTKTEVSRIVPISKHLIEYGFLEFVKSIKKGQLWPEVRPGKHTGQWSQNVSPQVSVILRGAGLTKEYVGHSWRHTLKTRLRSTTPDSVNDWITHPRGRKQSVAAKYGRVEVQAMKKAVDSLSYKVNWPKD